MKLNRILYLGYYLKQLDREKFDRFLQYSVQQTGKSKYEILSDLLASVFRYNISILEYFQFRFFELSKKERSKWAGTGYMYEYQLEMNPTGERHLLDDKRLFYKNYREYFRHQVADDKELQNPEAVESLLCNLSGRLVFKASDGKCGAQVEIRNSVDFSSSSIAQFMAKKDYGVVEEFIKQHPDLNRLSPTAVNTVRIFTQLDNQNEVDILGCRLRISVDSPVDNMAAGNLAAPVDERSGIVSGPAVYSDITKPECSVHPMTSVRITGFQIPFWYETMEMVKEAARLHPQNRSVGWDVVIMSDGPGLIEGNHDWCKLLWQMPVKQGLKSKLEVYLSQPTSKSGASSVFHKTT